MDVNILYQTPYLVKSNGGLVAVVFKCLWACSAAGGCPSGRVQLDNPPRLQKSPPTFFRVCLQEGREGTEESFACWVFFWLV